MGQIGVGRNERQNQVCQRKGRERELEIVREECVSWSRAELVCYQRTGAVPSPAT